jgi:hypothetical protein
MHTARNATSLEEVKEGLLSYIDGGADEFDKKLAKTFTPEDLANNLDFTIDTSDTPFAEEE